MIQLRPVTAEDSAFLLKVYASAREEELAQADWDEAQKLAFLASQLHAQKVSYDQRFPDAAHDVILCDGEAAGQIWVGRNDDEIRLLDIALLSEHRNKGIGTMLVKRLQREALASGKRLGHCVFNGNTRVMSLYTRLGFVHTHDLGAYCNMEWKSDREETCDVSKPERMR